MPSHHEFNRQRGRLLTGRNGELPKRSLRWQVFAPISTVPCAACARDLWGPWPDRTWSNTWCRSGRWWNPPSWVVSESGRQEICKLWVLFVIRKPMYYLGTCVTVQATRDTSGNARRRRGASCKMCRYMQFVNRCTTDINLLVYRRLSSFIMCNALWRLLADCFRLLTD